MSASRASLHTFGPRVCSLRVKVALVLQPRLHNVQRTRHHRCQAAGGRARNHLDRIFPVLLRRIMSYARVIVCTPSSALATIGTSGRTRRPQLSATVYRDKEGRSEEEVLFCRTICYILKRSRAMTARMSARIAANRRRGKGHGMCAAGRLQLLTGQCHAPRQAAPAPASGRANVLGQLVELRAADAWVNVHSASELLSPSYHPYLVHALAVRGVDDAPALAHDFANLLVAQRNLRMVPLKLRKCGKDLVVRALA